MSAINPVRRLSRSLAPAFLWLCLSGMVHGQTQTPPARPRPPATSTLVFVHVRDASGHPLAGVSVLLDGLSSGEFATDGEGVVRIQAMRDGGYHLKFERQGYTTQERDLTLRRGQPDVIDVALADALPAEPRAPPPPAQTPPGPPARTPPSSASTPAAAPPPSGEQKTVSIPTFLDRNLIGPEPLKESVLGCNAAATTRLLQVRGTLAEHVHENADETLYVVAGEGVLVNSNHAAASVSPGSLSVIPRGSPHSLERRAKNPLIVLSILSGVPCPGSTTK
jgi:quercetin dioxygenase-like cupin family protein